MIESPAPFLHLKNKRTYSTYRKIKGCKTWGECNFMFKRNKGKDKPLFMLKKKKKKKTLKKGPENPYYFHSLDHYIIQVRLM
jgi:hypothetical protein